MLEAVLSENLSLEEITAQFRAHGDPTTAHGMAAYMKDQFRYLGIKKPEREKIQRLWRNQIKNSKELDRSLVLSLWREPEREFQYFAIDILCTLKNHLNADDLPFLETLITEKSWWDTVDMLSSGIIGPLCLKAPEIIDAYILPWADSDNLWLRRSAILFQLKYKLKTDTELLSKIILLNCNTKEFFLNKAIGWSLREFSKTDPDWVRSFISQHTLHSLSVREAVKYL